MSLLLDFKLPAFNKEYLYFNKENEFQTKQLNIFQRLIRKLFGCYSETHLSNVVKKGYTYTCQEKCNHSPTWSKNFIKLVKKEQEKPGFSKGSMKRRSLYKNIVNYTIPAQEKKIHIDLKYKFNASLSTEQDPRLSAIRFIITSQKKGQPKKTYKVSLRKNADKNKVEVIFPKKFFGEVYVNTDTMEWRKDQLESEDQYMLNQLVLKIVRDSGQALPSDALVCYADRYGIDIWGVFAMRLPPGGKSSLNKEQEEKMRNLGWRGEVSKDSKKKWYILESQEVYQQEAKKLSIAFASSLL